MSRTLNILILLVALFILVFLNIKKEGGKPPTTPPAVPQKEAQQTGNVPTKEDLPHKRVASLIKAETAHTTPSQKRPSSTAQTQDEDIALEGIAPSFPEKKQGQTQQNIKQSKVADKPLETVVINGAEHVENGPERPAIEPGKASTPGKDANGILAAGAPSPVHAPKEYVVKKGEYLYMIAAKFNLPLGKLIQANPQIRDPDFICPGQIIFVPAE